ncbi:MAG: DUF1028 domain-containing protein, partial [Armatimonadetes bacterium]|nr:DUF1028 domain-containing protein [Armatimonadota bacterium]
NMLANDGVLPAVAAAFRATSGELVDRLLAALEAGERAGGDKRGKQSAALIVVRQGLITYIDLRVDDHPEPVKELRRLFHLYDAEVLHPQGLHLHDRPPDATGQAAGQR